MTKSLPPRVNESGQAILIVLLSMVVALTVVLSIIGSSTSDIRNGTTEGASQRAFSAAESGVERALVTNSGSTGNVNSGASFNSTVTGLSKGLTNFVYPQNITNGDAATFWFVGHDANGNLSCASGNNCYIGGNDIRLCWGVPGTAANTETTPAIEVSVFYLSTAGDYTTTKVAKQIYDPNSNRRSSNAYYAADINNCTIGTTSFAFRRILDINGGGTDDFHIPGSAYNNANGLQFMLVKLLYNTAVSQPVGLDVSGGTGSLPSQGNLVASVGNTGQATRKIEVTRAYQQLPPIFDSAIFSPVGLTQ